MIEFYSCTVDLFLNSTAARFNNFFTSFKRSLCYYFLKCKDPKFTGFIFSYIHI